MKVIELLAKIANGEETHFDTKLNDKSVSVRYYNDRNFSSSTDPEMLTIADIIKSLNDEVEIIEEDKKIRKITLLGEEIKLGSLSNWLKDSTNNEEKIASCIECNAMKINEIIEYINGGTNGE